MEKKFNFVYITTNLITGKQYVGDHSTNNLEKDKYLGSGKPYFLNALNEYGQENFKREILEFFNTKEEAFNAQEKYIIQYSTLVPNGYNISPKGGHGISGCLSEETKEKIRIKNTGKKRSKETKEKQRLKKLGTKRSDESKNKQSETFKINGSKKKENHHMWGKQLSPEHKKALTTSKIGKPTIYSEEAKNKMSESAKNRKSPSNYKPISEEHQIYIRKKFIEDNIPFTRIARELNMHKDRIKRFLINQKIILI